MEKTVSDIQSTLRSVNDTCAFGKLFKLKLSLFLIFTSYLIVNVYTSRALLHTVNSNLPTIDNHHIIEEITIKPFTEEKKSEKEQQEHSKKEEFWQIASQMKLLVDTPDKIWNAMEHKNFLIGNILQLLQNAKMKNQYGNKTFYYYFTLNNFKHFSGSVVSVVTSHSDQSTHWVRSRSPAIDCLPCPASTMGGHQPLQILYLTGTVCC